MNIPIVIAAYNRELPLARLFASVSTAMYPCQVKLIISIDGGGAKEVITLAEDFVWEFGEKEVIVHSENLGLRNHIVSCGALASYYDGVILLEDDLSVSPRFYTYALAAAEYYRECNDISGISLYAYLNNETAFLPFKPLHDGYDAYFLQLPCSWGQLWLKEQWWEFSKWYEKYDRVFFADDPQLPTNICAWPETSWKKYFAKYMVEQNKFFVYPQVSYTTNFGDSGQHHRGTDVFQVPLVYADSGNYRFSPFAESVLKYDAFCELLPECLQRMTGELHGYDFEVDLFGTKSVANITRPWILTTKKCSSYAKSYARQMVPPELNVIHNIAGEDIFLAEVGRVDGIDSIQGFIWDKATQVDEQKYYFHTDDIHYTHLYWARNRLKQLEEDGNSLEEHYITYNEATARLQKMESSLSWRLTAPVRKLLNMLRKLSHKVSDISRTQ